MPLDVLELTTILEPCALPDFVETPEIKKIAQRGLTYIKAGFPIHLRGGAGTGKTTLALHIASLIGRPVVLIHGDEEFSSSDLIGNDHGYRMKKVVDKYVARVLKVEENLTKKWVDHRLTVACRHGFTLIYDEFTRSRPEANNVLLSILQEKMLDFPRGKEGDTPYLNVHPDFTAIFTSNPEEYAGTYRTPDALRDRMITIDLDYHEEKTEIAIILAKSQLPREQVEKIVKIVRELRKEGICEFSPTVRACIMIAKSLKLIHGKNGDYGKLFKEVITEILYSQTSRTGAMDKNAKIKDFIKNLIEKHCKN